MDDRKRTFLFPAGGNGNPAGRGLSCCGAGGEKPHIGCVVLAIPRPSLTGDGSVSVTSSVLNITGHKDEELCRCLAEMLARKKNAVTVCTGGFHVDHIQKEQIAEVTEAIREIEKELEQLQ